MSEKALNLNYQFNGETMMNATAEGVEVVYITGKALTMLLSSIKLVSIRGQKLIQTERIIKVEARPAKSMGKLKCGHGRLGTASGWDFYYHYKGDENEDSGALRKDS